MERPNAVVLLTQEMEARCFDPADFGRIAAVTTLRRAETDTLTDAWQEDALRGAVIAITGWGTRPLSPAMLAAAPDLRLVCHAAGSVKGLVDPRHAHPALAVSTARAVNAVPVAEFAFGIMLTAMKGLWFLPRDRWEPQAALPRVHESRGAVVGLVGASHTGREMARLCRTLPLAALLIHDPYLDDAGAAALGAEQVSLDDLMARSDVVSIHAPATEETRHMINAANLALMRDGAILINTARGSLVDEAALIEELGRGRIFACLDVTDPEPPAADSPLWRLSNCLITPHLAGALKEYCKGFGALVADEVEAYVNGRPLAHALDRAVWDRYA
jgi:phosphoglycerate dehydrogenase-like enzyme